MKLINFDVANFVQKDVSKCGRYVCVQLVQSRERTAMSGLAVRCGCAVDGNVERKFRSEIEAY